MWIKMLRTILGFIVGLLVAMGLIAAIELSGFAILGKPAELDSPDPKIVQAAVAKLPTLAFVMLVLAYTIGSFGGAFTSAMICRQARLVVPILIGSIVWASTLYWLLKISSPWLVWLSLVTIPVATLAGAFLALILRPSPLEGPQPYDMRKKGMACK